MTVRFAREELTEALFEEASPLLLDHWKEVAHYPDIALAPDFARYFEAQDAGRVRVFTARDDCESNRLVGYALFFVMSALHYAGSLQAINDVIFVDPDARGRTGYAFIQFCEIQLVADGAEVVYYHGKNAHPQLGRVLGHQGYDAQETLYSKRI